MYSATCPICGANSHSVVRVIGERPAYAAGLRGEEVRLYSCKFCAAEARQQLRTEVAAELVGSPKKARSELVSAALHAAGAN